jgi:hypothetical protein
VKRIVPAITVIALAIAATAAYGAATRAEYVAQVDPICQAGKTKLKRESRKYGHRIRALRKQGIDTEKPTKRVLRLAVRFYDRVARIQRSANQQIAAVPPAPGDEQLVAEWLRLRSKRIKLTNRAIHAYARSRKAHQFRRLMGRANTAEVNAESLVADFHFQHCTPLLAD